MPLKIRAPKMPKLVTPLTDIQLRHAKPSEKPYKLSDGGGMYVEVMPNGSKFWRMKVRQANGKESERVKLFETVFAISLGSIFQYERLPGLSLSAY